MICRICQNEIVFRFHNADQLRERQLCFTCDFWWQKVELRVNGDVNDLGYRIARIRNNHYTIYPDGSTAFEGFGGHKHVIRFNNGDQVTTHNLWHQGEIPKHFRGQLPNNAEFVDTRQTCKCRAKFEPITEGQTKCLNCVMGLKPQRW